MSVIEEAPEIRCSFKAINITYFSCFGFDAITA